MSSNYDKSMNWYGVLTCAAFIVLAFLFYISDYNIPVTSKGINVHFKVNKSAFNSDIIATKENRFNIKIKEQFQNFSANVKDETVLSNKRKLIQNESETLLHRTRRYLIFPEGSSFQLVFDLIIPIVDYTNFAIMGITCAVAWELPSRPPSEIEEYLVDKLNDGTLGLSRNDSIDNIKYVDTPQRQKPSNDQTSKITYVQPSYYSNQKPVVYYNQQQTYSGENNIDEYRYKSRPVYSGYQKPFINSNVSRTNYNPPFRLKSVNNERVDKNNPYETSQKSYYPKRPPVKGYYRQFSPSSATKSHQKGSPTRKQHAVYHIMGKRNTRSTKDPVLETLDKIHLRYHRSSRHSIYSKIEALLHSKGKNGTECVLRALCETGQRKHEKKPGSFVSEILRTLFTLPEPDEMTRTKNYHREHQMWDEAHQERGNCAEIYPQCDDLINNTDYIF